MKYYYSNSPGEKIGPAAGEELVRLAETGALAETARVKSLWRNHPAGEVGFLKEAFKKRGDGNGLTWQNGPENAGGEAFPPGYANDVYFSPFWKRSRRNRRMLKAAFWLLLVMLAGGAALFAGSFSFLAAKTTLLGIFGNILFGLTAFFVLFPVAFSLILCRLGIAATYAEEAQVRAAEDLRKIRLLNEPRPRSKTAAGSR